MSNPMVAGLALVRSGWGGDVTVTIGATVATVTTSGRTSAAEVWEDVVREAAKIHGGEWEGYPTAAGKLAIRGPSAFTLAATSTAQSRLGLTGTYTGASSYTATSAHSDGVYPSYGLACTVGAAQSDRGEPTADGAYGWPGRATSARGRVVCYGTFSEVNTLEATLDGAETWDAWIAGRIVSRVRLGAVRRSRWGDQASQATLTADAMEVRL